ncbi:unnamed protein product [Meganyctiphanes norvegica]|uniref:XK-related protein n=1 Tax=Meganyctiphanes norvegica TaxID=48144 RepID=A0AAV2R853_MEGNR
MDLNKMEKTPPDLEAVVGDTDLENSLLEAARKGHHQILNDLLKQGVDLKGDVGGNALCAAAEHGHHQVISVMVDHGMDLEGAEGGKALCIATIQGHHQILSQLLRGGVNADATWGGETATHLASRYGKRQCIEVLLDNHANPDPRSTRKQQTPLMYAVVNDQVDCVEALVSSGADITATDKDGRTALELALKKRFHGVVEWLKEFQRYLKVLKSAMESGKKETFDATIVSTVVQGNGAAVTAGLVGGFLGPDVEIDFGDRHGCNLLGLAMWAGQSNIVKLLQKKYELVDEDKDWRRIKSEEFGLKIVDLIEDTKICQMEARRTDGFRLLHLATLWGYKNMIKKLLSFKVDINCVEYSGYTPVYYAIKSSRFDILQLLLRYGLENNVHVQVNGKETLLKFLTERNNRGQNDNAIIRMLEYEKEFHKDNKASAQMCLRKQLGTTEAATSALMQLQALFKPSPGKICMMRFQIILLSFLVPFGMFYLDVGTDINLSLKYYMDFQNKSKQAQKVSSISTARRTSLPIGRDKVPTFDTNGEIYAYLTLFFTILPMILVWIWHLVIHLTRDKTLPVFQRLSKFSKILSFCIPPLAPAMTNFENAYAQWKYMDITQRDEPAGLHDEELDAKQLDQKISKYYKLKHAAQMKAAISNIIEATFESAFQLILQLYLVAENFQVKSELSTIWSYQLISALVSLMTLCWAFTSYHRFSKLGGLSFINAMPLFFAILFQVVSRAIACIIFMLAYNWMIFIVLSLHLIIVMILKCRFEGRAGSEKRSYFHIFLGTMASTLVYFRFERPSQIVKQQYRQSTVIIQVLFLILAFVENVILLVIGIVGIKGMYHHKFIICATVVCSLSFVIGVILQGVYYGVWGHPWANINGPQMTRDSEKGIQIKFYYHKDQMTKQTTNDHELMPTGEMANVLQYEHDICEL